MKFRRKLNPETSINMVPMIDVVFQLILFFTVSTTFVVYPGIAVLLPSSTSSDPTVMTRLVVTIAAADQIYMEDVRYTLTQLGEKLSAMSKVQKEKIQSIVVDADKSVDYETLVKVLDVLRKGGFKNINLRTRQQKK